MDRNFVDIMNRLHLQSFGPIKSADVHFGDLTILIGQQASGKSVFLQLLKLLIDKRNIRAVLEQYGYIWRQPADSILDLYFGEGMSPIWTKQTAVQFDNASYSKDFILPAKGKQSDSTEERLFYIPAQRILSLADGRPKNFMEFDSSTPYILRHFSETLRLLFQNGLRAKESMFPVRDRLKEPIRKSLNESIFHDGKVFVDDSSGLKKLRMKIDDMNVPFMTWSAGQKEFMPLLMGFYWLCPPSAKARKGACKYVVIEEPEMGLHPQAIMSVLVQILDLLARGYKVIVSTHSPILLEFAWAFQWLKLANKPGALYTMFGMPQTPATANIFTNILEKTIKTFYFAREGTNVVSKDISDLDAASEDIAIAEWGGLSAFASRVSSIVAEYAADE